MQLINSPIKDHPKINSNLAALCVCLGILCLLFPFFAYWINNPRFPHVVSLLSYCMAFGLFLTAVGGWASGEWQGWTFGGAAATVVALFLLMISSGGNPAPPNPKPKIVVKVTGKKLFKNYSALEVFEETGERMFVAPHKRLHSASVLIEEKNLKSDCIAFSFTPIAIIGASNGTSEVLDVKVASGYFQEILKKAKIQNQREQKIHLHFQSKSRSLFLNGPPQTKNDKPVSGRGRCSDFHIASLPRSFDLGKIRIVSTAHAQELNQQELIAAINSEDSQTRRDARDWLAGMEPTILPHVFMRVPENNHRDYYRSALGAATITAKMIGKGVNPSDVQSVLGLQEIQLLAKLTSHPDKTMRRWATAAIVRLQDERVIDPLVNGLTSAELSTEGKFNAAYALLESAPFFRESAKKQLIESISDLQIDAGPNTRAILSEIAGLTTTPVKKGWTYLGTRFSENEFDWYFTWSGDTSKPPLVGQMITAEGDVFLRKDHIKFDVDVGWKNSEAQGVLSKNERVVVQEIKEIAPGFFWALVTAEG